MLTQYVSPPESTPDAVGRILKSVSQGVKPRRLVDAGKENRTPAAGKGSNQSGALSPLTQGHVRRARKGEYPFSCSNSSFRYFRLHLAAVSCVFSELKSLFLQLDAIVFISLVTLSRFILIISS